MRTLSSLTILLATASLLTGAETGDSRVSLLECKMKAAHDDTVYPCRSGARFASGRPFLNSYGLWVTGDVLYWTAYEGGTEFAYSSTEPGTEMIIGRTRPVHYEWDVGYRLGAGWVAPNDNMEFSLLFTRVNPDGEASITAPDGGRTSSMGNTIANDAAAGSLSSEIKYSILDFELSRSYFVSKYFYLRPYFGSRGAWISQSGNSYFNVPDSTAHYRTDYKGGGLRVGTDTKWFFARHWNFFLGGSTSATYGQAKTETGGNTDGYNLDLASTNYRILISAQTQMGLGWETTFACSSNQIAFNLAYELNYWWRANQQPALQTVRSAPYGVRQSDDLAFHGLTADIQLSF